LDVECHVNAPSDARVQVLARASNNTGR
jgi:hypothetical protein